MSHRTLFLPGGIIHNDYHKRMLSNGTVRHGYLRHFPRNCVYLLFLEIESHLLVLCYWQWIIKENVIIHGGNILIYLHIGSGRIMKGHVMEFNFTLNSIQFVTIFWHAVNDRFLEWDIKEHSNDINCLYLMFISPWIY